nr:sensor histidine kinase [Lachnoclostridium phocaeense]
MKKFKDWNIKQKLLIIFIVGVLVPIMLLLVFSIQVSGQIMTKKVEQLISSNLIQTKDQFSLNLDVFYKILYQVTVDDIVIENINDLDQGGNVSEQAYTRLLQRLRQVNSGEESIRCISIVTNNGTSLSFDFNTGSSLDTLWNSVSDMRETEAYERASRQAAIALTSTEKFEEDAEDIYVFHLSKQIYDLNNLGKGPIATAILSIDIDVLENICTIEQEKSSEEVKFILDDRGKIAYFPDKTKIGSGIDMEDTEEFVKKSKIISGTETAEVHIRDYRTGWYFYYAYDRAYMLKDVRTTGIIIAIAGLVLVVIAGSLILYMLNHIIKSVQSTIYGMNEMKKGNLNVKVKVDGKDEIGEIAETFNEMSVRIQDLISEKEETAIKQKNAEIKALEAQINPHFIYNTLDSINWMAIEHGEFEISKVLRDLGIILRYSINKSNEKATLKMVKEWLDKYIELQRMRFGYSFSCSIDIDKSLDDAYIYKLLLQPFIENSILHGFEGMEEGGVLRINIFPDETGERMCIIIEDNGLGMSQEKVDEFNDRERAVKNDRGSIGLHNAFSRMELYYGNKAEWTVSSVEGMGTVIVLKLPIEMRDEK